MRNLLLICAVLLPIACSRPAAIESVDVLVANPERLNELRAQCKADYAQVGDVQCNAVAEATRLRFMRPSASPYANNPVAAPKTPRDSQPEAANGNPVP